MTDFSIFTDAHLDAAEARYDGDFTEAAAEGRLSLATACHNMAAAIRVEIERRANARALRAVVTVEAAS